MPSRGRDRARGHLPLLIALLLLAGVTACGQKGPLYRADDGPRDTPEASEDAD